MWYSKILHFNRTVPRILTTTQIFTHLHLSTFRKLQSHFKKSRNMYVCIFNKDNNLLKNDKVFILLELIDT